jgi:hypothetical protein
VGKPPYTSLVKYLSFPAGPIDNNYFCGAQLSRYLLILVTNDRNMFSFCNIVFIFVKAGDYFKSRPRVIVRKLIFILD